MCALCRNRNTPKVSPYVPNPLEEHLRKFISDSTGFNRWHSKWLRLVKKHYKVTTINEQILQDSLNDNISGLGKTYNCYCTSIEFTILVKKNIKKGVYWLSLLYLVRW